jgi:hypothetical protein
MMRKPIETLTFALLLAAAPAGFALDANPQGTTNESHSEQGSHGVGSATGSTADTGYQAERNPAGTPAGSQTDMGSAHASTAGTYSGSKAASDKDMNKDMNKDKDVNKGADTGTMASDKRGREANGQLPATASPLPLVGMFGFLSLLCAFALRRVRRFA